MSNHWDPLKDITIFAFELSQNSQVMNLLTDKGIIKIHADGD